jgi:hypothetical protein
MSYCNTGRRAVATALFALFVTHSATAQSISAADIKSDYENPSFSASFSVLAYSPWDATPSLDLKTQDGFTGVGVSGVTHGEIDWRNGVSESITVDLVTATTIADLSLGLLFNGPEYSDVREVAQITINGDATAYRLRTTGTENLARWFYGDTFIGNVSYILGAGTQSGQAGAITLVNPFGSTVVDTITFAAAQGYSGGLCGTTGVCTNQSDYNVISITPVPEPETYALMLAGLGAIGVIARRRRACG